MLDWERFEVQLIVYFRNRYCRRWCGIRDGNFLRGLASSGVQAKSYRHRGEPGANACRIEVSCPCKIGVANFKAGNRGRCVSYFTLRIIVILMETIKDLYYQPACLNPFFNCASHALG